MKMTFDSRGYITIPDHKAHLNSLDYMKAAADQLVLKIYSYIPYWISERLLRAYQRIVEDRRVNSLSSSKIKLSSALFGMRTCLPRVYLELRKYRGELSLM